MQQAVCVRRKENEHKRHEIPPNTEKTHHGNYPQKPGDRDHLETACDETRPTREPILARFLRTYRICGNGPPVYTRVYILALRQLRCLYTGWFSVFDHLPNCIVIIVFLGIGREILLLLVRYAHRSLLRAPAYLAHTSTFSPFLLDTSRVPNRYRLQSSRITKPLNGTVPFDSSESEVT